MTLVTKGLFSHTNGRYERLCVVASVSVGNFVLSLRFCRPCASPPHHLNIIIISPAEFALKKV